MDKNQLLGFEHSPTRRGTLDILYTCLPILITCVWASLHLDLTRRPKSALERVSKKVAHMVLSILAPEFMLGSTVFQHGKARKAMRTVNDYYATYSSSNHAEDLWTLADGFFSEMKGFRYQGKPVDASDIVNLVKKGKIAPVWSHARDIRDRSKSDHFAKLFACTQALWLVIQCFARKAEGLPMSLLELGTIGYVLVFIVVYGLLWDKPKDVTTYITIPSKGSGSSEFTTLADNGDEETGDPLADKPLLSDSPHSSPTIHPFIERHSDNIAVAFLIVCCAVYGGYHCFAWNFIFPSLAEKWLWRVSSLVTSLPVSWIAWVVLWNGGDIQNIVTIVLIIIYALLRAIIVVEMFISLRRMPAGVFETVQWTNLIPHF